MEGQIQNPSSGGMPKFVIPTVVAALIVLAAIGFYLYNSNQNNSGITPATTTMSASTAPLDSEDSATAAYKDGTYTVNGDYVSPGGPRQVGVTLVLTGGKISDASAEILATDATSIRFQTEFAENFKPMIVGKSLDEVSLSKVSGSSLTPKGFNDAVEKIKVEAAS